MAIIEADSPEIEKHLHKLKSLIIEGGGGFHSNLVLSSQAGQLSVKTKEKMPDGKEIMRLPRAVLMPGDQYEMAVSGDEFIVSYPKNSILSDLQKKITDSMYALYNLTNKVALHKEYSFLLSLQDHPALLDKLAAGRTFPGKINSWVQEIKKGLKGKKLERFIAETFLPTRPLGYTDYVRLGSVSVIMPILDFTNHHWAGGGFLVGPGTRKGDLSMQNSQPIEGSLECFAFYGIMDGFDSLVRYDFVDAFAPIVRSVAVELEAPEGGHIAIKDFIGQGSKQPLAKQVQDLSRYVPNMKLAIDKDTKQRNLVAGHIIVPHETAPLALQRVLHLMLANLRNNLPVLDKKVRDRWVRDAQEKIVQTNQDYYTDLLEYTQGLVKEKGASFGLSRIEDLAKLQLKKLGEYQIQG